MSNNNFNSGSAQYMPVNSHYIPQFILRNFGEGMSCYNVVTGEFRYKRNPNTIYSEMGYYPDDIENLLNTKAESIFSPVLKKFLISDTIELTRNELAAVKRFLLVTKLRSKEMMDIIEHAKKTDIEEYQKNPEMVSHALGRFVSEIGSNETTYDYWIRSIRCVLEEETGYVNRLEYSKNATFFAVHFARAFSAAYLAFWDAPEGEEFIINDAGMTYEMERAFYDDGYNHDKLDTLKRWRDSCKPDELERIAAYNKMIDFNLSFFENFCIFPFSPKRAIVLINPFFKMVHGELGRLLTPHESIPDLKSTCNGIMELLFGRITNFTNPELTKPNEYRYTHEGYFSEDDLFRYHPVTLSSWELRTVNTLIAGATKEWIGFGDLKAIKGSFERMRDLLPKEIGDPTAPLFVLFDHADDEEFLRKAEKNSTFSELQNLDVPERFRHLLGRRVGMPFIIDQSNNEHYPQIAAAIVLWRNKLLQFDSDCDEETALGVFEKLSLNTLERYARFFKKSEECEFDKNMGAVFFEIEARKGDKLSAFRIGRYYRDGRHVPKNLKKAEHYFLQSAQLGNPEARVALCHMYCSEKRIDEAIAIVIDPNEEVNPIQYHARAHAYLQQGNLEKAIEDFEKAIENKYYCSSSDLLTILLDEDSKYYDLEKSKEITERLMPDFPAIGVKLVNYYSNKTADHPEYVPEISRLLELMIEHKYSTAIAIKQKLQQKRIL